MQNEWEAGAIAMREKISEAFREKMGGIAAGIAQMPLPTKPEVAGYDHH